MNPGATIKHKQFGEGTFLTRIDDRLSKGIFDGEERIFSNKFLEKTSRTLMIEDPSLVKYTTDYDRAQRPWVFQHWYPELAWIMGFAAQNNAYLRWSGQLDKGSIELNADDEAFEVGSDSHGEKFDVVMPNPNIVGLDDALDINFIQRNGRRRVSLNKEGFFKFLVEYGFQIGRGMEQDVNYIAAQIPQDYRADFEAGEQGTTR